MIHGQFLTFWPDVLGPRPPSLNVSRSCRFSRGRPCCRSLWMVCSFVVRSSSRLPSSPVSLSQPHHPFHSPPAGMSSALPLPAVQDHSPSLPSAVLLLVCCFPSSPSVHTDSSQAPSYLASSCLPSLPSALCCLPALSLLVLRYVRPAVSALCISQAFCSSPSCVLLPLHFPLAFRAGGRYDRR